MRQYQQFRQQHPGYMLLFRMAAHDVVVFMDACVCGSEPFTFGPIQPERAVSFSSHSMTPPTVLALAQELFGASTRGYVLGVRGYCFDEFSERLSPQAQMNLDAARRFLEVLLQDEVFRSPVPSPN